MRAEIVAVGHSLGMPEEAIGMYCHAARDGECVWRHCPQIRDGEPERSCRHCPLDIHEEERGYQ